MGVEVMRMKFSLGFRADYPDGGWWEVWIEVLPEEATPWEEVGG